MVGKSVIKRLRQMHPESNIVAVDYDPGASEVNQLNRIKLMISVAKENYKNGLGFRLASDDDPTMRPDRPELDDSIVNERGGSHAIHLTPEQLAQIEQAKVEAGVK